MNYTTGNDISDRVAEINFTGNVIPSVWFKTVVNDKGRPYLLAIMILSEIVYWYRPVEVRDENTGEFLGYRTKFKHDLLQKSYKDLAEYYQVSKRQVTDAVIALEKLGVISRDFRTVSQNGTLCNNVLFIRLNPDKLYNLTYPHDTDLENGNGSKIDSVDNVDKNVPLSRKKGTGSHKISGEPVTKFCETNTEITTETTNGFNNHISSHLTRDEYAEQFADQIGYDEIRYDYDYESSPCAVLDQCVEIAGSVMASTKRYQLIGGEKQPTQAIVKLLQKLNIIHMKYVINSFLTNTQEVKKIQSYLLTCMVNAVYSYDVKLANDFTRLKGT